MSDNPNPVERTYTIENLGWQNAFGEPDPRPVQLLREAALKEMDRPRSPAYLAMKQNFDKIDLDHDGFLSPGEIKIAARTDSDLAELDRNPQDQFSIKNMVNDGPNNARGISRRDVQALGAADLATSHAKNDPHELKLAAEFLNSYFDRVSQRKDGFISENDLEQLIRDPCLKPAFREKFLLMERYLEPVSELYRDKILKVMEHKGISRNDLKVLIARDGQI